MTGIDRPTVYVIAGPNGAGKTTFAEAFLPDFVQCREFLNADLIAAGLSPFAPETQDFRAGRLLLTRIRELVDANKTFSFETTLSGKTYVPLLNGMKERGYMVVLFFLWLPNPDIAVKRVSSRVRQGGHDVPEHIVRRRYAAGLGNLVSLYMPIASIWRLYDASRLPPRVVAHQEDDALTIFDAESYERISKDKAKSHGNRQT